MSKAEKGHARAAGRSVQDVLLKDTVPAPLPLLASAYDFLGDDDLDAQRYTEAGFAAKEMTKMWAKTWQWACREEHIPEPGDRYVYDIGPYSVIISRDEAGIVHAFRNSCTHRGTRLIGSEGTGFGTGITCPFHGWSWHCDGSLEQIPAKWDFPHVTTETHNLRPVACDAWGGFIFINLDAAAAPLSDQLEVMT